MLRLDCGRILRLACGNTELIGDLTSLTLEIDGLSSS